MMSTVSYIVCLAWRAQTWENAYVIVDRQHFTVRKWTPAIYWSMTWALIVLQSTSHRTQRKRSYFIQNRLLQYPPDYNSR